MPNGKRISIYFRAVSAVALPLLVGVFFSTVYADVAWEKLGEWRIGGWLAAACLGALTLLEWRWLGVLWDLCRARGRASAVSARRSSAAWAARRRVRQFRLAVVAASILFSFAVAELVFRLFDIRAPLPHSAAADYLAVDNTLNAWGLREPWNSLPEDDHRLRIIFLGDSIVYGDGVEREDTFCHVVEGLLGASRPEGVKTINMGYWGVAPDYELEKFLALKDRLRADVVVHVVYPNDLEIHVHRRLDGIYRIRDDELWVGEASYVLSYAERTIRYWVAWKRTIDFFRGGRNSEERLRAWTKFKTDVRACKRAVEDGGARYTLVMFPWLVRLDDYDLTDVHETMRAFALELGVPYLDLLELFAGREADALRVSLANEHPSALAHRMAAERIARFLEEEVLPREDIDPLR